MTFIRELFALIAEHPWITILLMVFTLAIIKTILYGPEV